MPDVTAIRLPKATGVTARPGVDGVYTTGGKLYVFDSANYFGVFVVRPDSRIYVPAAFYQGRDLHLPVLLASATTGTTLYSSNVGNQHSTLTKIAADDGEPGRAVRGDEAAAVLLPRPVGEGGHHGHRALQPDRRASAGVGREDLQDRPADGRLGSTSNGELLFASSLTLTNSNLYYIVGNGSATSWWYTSFKDHYIYRYAITGGATGGHAARAPTSAATRTGRTPAARRWRCRSRCTTSPSSPSAARGARHDAVLRATSAGRGRSRRTRSG